MYRFDFEIADLVWQVEMQMGRDGNRSFGLSGCFFLLFLKKNFLCTFFSPCDGGGLHVWIVLGFFFSFVVVGFCFLFFLMYSIYLV